MENDGFCSLFIYFFSTRRVCLRGTAACDKTSVYATCRAGAVGEGGVNMRRLGVGERYFFFNKKGVAAGGWSLVTTRW